ncbi:MAG TPA: tlde1 domain-containing protein [Methylocella sp.]|nr:tlde1 domain-containing protein [Methylocella sp.]
MLGVWPLYVHPVAPYDVKAPATGSAAATAANPYGVLFDPRFLSASTPVSLMQNFPLVVSLKPNLPAPSAATAKLEKAEPPSPPTVLELSGNTPLPVPRPAELGLPDSASSAPSHRLAQQNRKTAAPATPANRTFFEKLFGMLQPSGSALAYAAPEDGIGNARALSSTTSPRYDRWTAIYDVVAHTVYMPDGTRLEAHSGLGNRLDDPRYVNERMRGATPPNVYQLQPREQLFHGVQALRLVPTGTGDLYGRTGLLAHSYMLGPNGDSNGCVSFKNYDSFLQAYKKGEIKRLVVVARLN